MSAVILTDIPKADLIVGITRAEKVHLLRVKIK